MAEQEDDVYALEAAQTDPYEPLPTVGDTTLRPNLGYFSPAFRAAFEGPPVGAGPAATPDVDPRAKMFANILALLLAGGGAAGAGQQLFGRPPQSTITPRLSPQALQMFGGAQQQFGQTGNMLQALMGALQNPHIPPQLSLLTEQAFQPQLGSLYSRAVEAGRQRGFYDAPATSPPGGAILGPGLADLQGQMANAKLNLYQNNIANMLRAAQGSQGLAQGQGQIAMGLPAEQRTRASQPTILDVLGKVSPVISDIGKIWGTANPPLPPQIPAWLSGIFSSLSGAG